MKNRLSRSANGSRGGGLGGHRGLTRTYRLLHIRRCVRDEHINFMLFRSLLLPIQTSPKSPMSTLVGNTSRKRGEVLQGIGVILTIFQKYGRVWPYCSLSLTVPNLPLPASFYVFNH